MVQSAHHRRRAFIARGFALLLIVMLTLLAGPNFAAPEDDPPPPEDYTVTESSDLDGDEETDTVVASPSGESGTGDDPGRVEGAFGRQCAVEFRSGRWPGYIPSS